jgi:hypothetical protein
MANPDSETGSAGLAERSRQLRAAVIAGDHSGAERAAASYVEALRKHWESLSEQERAKSTVPARARELLAWAREMTIIQRTLTRDQLTVLQKASRYETDLIVPCGWQVQG